jgi:hypothetical protein
MAYGVTYGRPHRASGELAYHILDVMQTSLEAASAGKTLEIASTVERPAPLPTGLPKNEVD